MTEERILAGVYPHESGCGKTKFINQTGPGASISLNFALILPRPSRTSLLDLKGWKVLINSLMPPG